MNTAVLLRFADQLGAASAVREPGSMMLMDDGGTLSAAELVAIRAELEAYKVCLDVIHTHEPMQSGLLAVCDTTSWY